MFRCKKNCWVSVSVFSRRESDCQLRYRMARHAVVWSQHPFFAYFDSNSQILFSKVILNHFHSTRKQSSLIRWQAKKYPNPKYPSPKYPSPKYPSSKNPSPKYPNPKYPKSQKTQAQNTQGQNAQSQNIYSQKTQSPKIPKMKQKQPY